MHRVLLGLALALIVGSVQAQPVVHVAQGSVSGAVEDGVSVYKGIPFAAPPVGPLRWRAPQPAANWDGVRTATAFGPVCPQAKLPLLMRMMPHVTMQESEDCLTINVWSPKAEQSVKLPVMVWIYGGAFRSGGSANPLFDGTDLAHHGVVVVTFNYRLGWLGFLDTPALAAESPDAPIGNYGLLDQIAALKWVRDNIAAFGGDAANVTIFGESAGGMSVDDLMVSPLAHGLFAKAISESGLGLFPANTASQAQAAGAQFAAKEQSDAATAQGLAKLRSLPVRDIIDAETDTPVASMSPAVDGKVLPDQPSVLFAQDKGAPVPFIAGSNSDEATLMQWIGMSPAEQLKLAGDALPMVRKVYAAEGPLSDDQLGREMFDDGVFAAGAQGLAGLAAKAGQPAYVYYFGYVADAFRAKVQGVGHGAELPYIFGLRGFAQEPWMKVVIEKATPKDLGIVAMMQSYWTNFAKTGNPNGGTLPAWQPTSLAQPDTLVVNDTTATTKDFRHPQIALAYGAWSKRTGLPLQ